MYVVFEGLDGSGKDTQLDILYKKLVESDKYINILRTREPTRRLKYVDYSTKTKEEILDIQMEDKAYLVDSLLSKVLNNGVSVLQSRSYLSSYGYQIAGGLDYDYVNDVIWKAYNKQELYKPDLILFFDIDPKTAYERISKRCNGDESQLEFFEKDGFLDRAYKAYQETVKNKKTFGYENIVIIDATQSIEDVTKSMMKAIYDKFT